MSDFEVLVLPESGVQPDVNGWVRPSDWVALPDISGAEQFVGLYAVWENGANFATVHCYATNGYTVDWGDGSAPENVSTNTTAYHTFSYADLASSSTSVRGYRQAIIRVTPQSTGHITTVYLYKQHNQTGILAQRTIGWLDIAINLPSCTSFALGESGQAVMARLLEHFEQVGTCALTAGGYMFSQCVSLKSVVWADTPELTGTDHMFYLCTSLETAPPLNLGSATSVKYLFNSCYSLKSIPAYDTHSATDISYMFEDCRSLAEIPAMNFGAATTVSSIFSGCYALQRILATGIKSTITISGQLSAAALNTLYGNLATVTTKTITVTSCWGNASDDPTIATAKGWTVSPA